MSSLVLPSLLCRRCSWIFHESHVCFISRLCVYAGAKVRYAETSLCAKLRVEEGIRVSRSFNNSLDVEYSEWRSTLPAGENRIQYRGWRHRYFELRTALTATGTARRYFILLLSLFGHSLLCAHVNSNRLKSQCAPTISISFRPIETSRTSRCLEFARIWQTYHGSMHTSPVDVDADLFYVRCWHKFSCMFPRVYTFHRIKTYICHCAVPWNSAVFNQALLPKCIWFDLSLKYEVEKRENKFKKHNFTSHYIQPSMSKRK